MNERLQQYLDKAKNFWDQLSVPKRVGILGTAVLLSVATAAGLILLNKDPMHLLYSDLSPEGSKSISKKLGELKIPYEVSEDRKSISVPQSVVHQARMELAKEGLPGEDVVGFEAFDTFNFGTSSYVQKIQYIRAVQGELVRSIQRIDAVKRSRVHLSLPPKKTFLEDQDPPKASVVLELKAGKDLSKQEIRSIAHIVSSAVEGLDPKQVTIVDTQGRFLHRPDSAGDNGESVALLELQRSIESEYERRVEALLTPIVGLGKVIAKVTAEVDSSKVSLTEENFEGERSVPQTITKDDVVNSGSRPNPLGIPGSRSNLPGAEVDNPPVPTANMSNERNTSTTTFAIPRSVTTTNKPSGSIKRITVAVVVDGKYQADPNTPEKETFVPRDPQELKRFQDLVANAVGFDEKRRDSINVTSMPFRTTDLGPVEEPGVFNWKEFLPLAIRNGLIGLVIVLFFALVLRPFLKWATLTDVVQELALMPQTVGELQIAQREPGVLALKRSIPVLGKAEILEEKLQKEKEKVEAEQQETKKEKEQALKEEHEYWQKLKEEEVDLIKRIGEKVAESPKKGFQIVSEWFHEETDGERKS